MFKALASVFGGSPAKKVKTIVPSQPQCIDKTSTTVLLQWTAPTSTPSPIVQYGIKYQTKSTEGGDSGSDAVWKGLKTPRDRTTVLIPNLNSDTTYVFKVRAVYEDGEEGQFSDVSDEVTTLVSLAKKLKDESSKLSEGPPEVYKLPVIKESARNNTDRIRKCTLLTEKRDPRKAEKTIMVIGATGSGKSTLIDGMINYMLDVSWDDNARFKVIDLTDEEREKQLDQSVSQTEWITCYSLNWLPGCQVDYHLNILDTPGFGDTRGIARDKQLVDQIRTFFTAPGDQGIETLDAVCFVTQAPLCRLTPTQRYIFDSILAIFGTDIKKNIFVLITFADGGVPPVLNTLKEASVPFEKEFVFNNSALYADQAKAKNGPIFWKMGKQSFDAFFSALRDTKTRSLKLTSDVLLTRRRLEDNISRIQRQITEGMQQMAIMREEERALERNQQLIADNKDFTYEVPEVHAVQIDLPPGMHTTTCLPCNRTCHDNCIYADDQDKEKCSSMTAGYCTVCPQQCHWDVHKNVPYIITMETLMVTKTYEETKKQYLSAVEQKEEKITVLDAIKAKFNELMEENNKMVNEVRQCINKLQEISLKQNPLSEVEYIDVLIAAENEEMKDGYKDRIDMYKELRKRAMSIVEITTDQFAFPRPGTSSEDSE